MDSANQSPTVEEIANLVVEKLMGDGKLSDLANADLMTIEEETVNQVDQITRAAMNQLLGTQAKVTRPPHVCPKCSGPLAEKAAQGRSLQSQRGRIHFKTGVFRCEACRLDFFPSTENSSL